MKLREDYRKMKGAQFSLEEFHDAFMKQGFPPIKIVRRALLGQRFAYTRRRLPFRKSTESARGRASMTTA